MKFLIVFSFLFDSCCPVQSAKWATAKYFNGTSCSVTESVYDDHNFPMLLDVCWRSEGDPEDTTTWRWTKATCDASELSRKVYMDGNCTILATGSAMQTSFPLRCSTMHADSRLPNVEYGVYGSTSFISRSIACDSEYDVSFINSYKTNPRFSNCKEDSLIVSLPVALGQCDIRLDYWSDSNNPTYFGSQSICNGEEFTSHRYADPRACSGESEEWAKYTFTCAKVYEDDCRWFWWMIGQCEKDYRALGSPCPSKASILSAVVTGGTSSGKVSAWAVALTASGSAWASTMFETRR